jgi:hypothetical protein
LRKGFKGVWIPAVVWNIKDLSIIEKILLVEIDSLDGVKKGGCFASNGYFAEFLNLSKSRVSEVINGLKKKHFINMSLKKTTKAGQIKTLRILKLRGQAIRKTEGHPTENRTGYSKNGKPYSENGECINTCIKPSTNTSGVRIKKTNSGLTNSHEILSRLTSPAHADRIFPDHKKKEIKK